MQGGPIYVSYYILYYLLNNKLSLCKLYVNVQKGEPSQIEFNCVKPAFANYSPSIVGFKISNTSFFSTYATVNIWFLACLETKMFLSN